MRSDELYVRRDFAAGRQFWRCDIVLPDRLLDRVLGGLNLGLSLRWRKQWPAKRRFDSVVSMIWRCDYLIPALLESCSEPFGVVLLQAFVKIVDIHRWYRWLVAVRGGCCLCVRVQKVFLNLQLMAAQGIVWIFAPEGRSVRDYAWGKTRTLESSGQNPGV